MKRLDEIEARAAFVNDSSRPLWRDLGTVGARLCDQDVPALVAALRAVLDLADVWDRDGEAESWAGSVRAAIAAHLDTP